MPKSDRDTNFKHKLEAEYPAILYTMIQGCLDWQRLGGLKKPASVAAAVATYFDAEDSIGAWIEECLQADSAAITPVGEAYEAFSEYIEKQGESVPSKKRFSTMMQQRVTSLSKKPALVVSPAFASNQATALSALIGGMLRRIERVQSRLDRRGITRVLLQSFPFAFLRDELVAGRATLTDALLPHGPVKRL